MPDRVSVPSSDFIRNVGYWQNEALRRPVRITHHGRERLVLTTPDEFDARRQGDHAARFETEVVLENLQDGYCAFDAALRLTRANRAAEALIGRTRDALRGASVAEAFPQPFASMLEEKLVSVIHARRPEVFAATLNGGALGMRAFPLGGGAGVLLGGRTDAHDQRMAQRAGASA